MKTSGIFGCIAAAALALVSCTQPDNHLVILHTNDTHSQIEPGSEGLGGVMRRKAVIDSIRGVEKNVLVVDAGDAVQGTLYFYLYGGKVEQEMLNILGTDIRILGNHEFDNGIDSLAAVLRLSKAQKLASNYKLDATPLAGMFEPYTIREYGDKRVAFIGINIDPTGIVTPGNYDGLEYLPSVATANVLAEKLKKDEKADVVIAVSHIGYNPKGLIGDSVLATNSRNIDIIIGGHSHDTIDPATPEGERRSRLRNLDGKEVLVVQTGKSGRRLGKIDIDLNAIGKGGRPSYELIRIDDRYDGYSDPLLVEALKPYSAGVDSLMHDWIGTTAYALKAGSQELLNYFSDFVFDAGSALAPHVDLAIANKGGLRTDLPEGRFSKGHIINLVPFRNYVTVLDVKGSDLKTVFDVMAETDGNGVSRNVFVEYEAADGDERAHADDIYISGSRLDPERVYRVATIDYLAKGGDYMKGLTQGTVVAQSDEPVYEELMRYIMASPTPIGGDTKPRWKAD